MNDVESLNLRRNYIHKLTKDSFTIYPNIKRLYLSLNAIFKVEPGALEPLDDLEVLDLEQNALPEVPPGLPKSLKKLYLSENPVVNMSYLTEATGLQVLHLRNCDMSRFPQLGVLPNLVELDMSDNKIQDLVPSELASLCRLARLNITDNFLYEWSSESSYCHCKQVEAWAIEYKLQIIGMHCPNPPPDEFNETCTMIPEEARAIYKDCMSEWEHRNMPFWAIGSGALVVLAILFTLCFCWRRRRRSNKAQSVPTENKDETGNMKPEPTLV
ncbi:decorin isoform X2 [Daktulosphaira vitifoliae]|nr:decorin isoform X2 [Daktulosphaira vitifoliae]